MLRIKMSAMWTKDNVRCFVWELRLQSGGCKKFEFLSDFPNTVNTLLSNILEDNNVCSVSPKFLLRKGHLHHVINYILSPDYKNKKISFQGKSWLAPASMIQKVLHCHQTVWWSEPGLVSKDTDNREFKVLGFKGTLSMYKGTKFDFCVHIWVLPKI